MLVRDDLGDQHAADRRRERLVRVGAVAFPLGEELRERLPATFGDRPLAMVRVAGAVEVAHDEVPEPAREMRHEILHCPAWACLDRRREVGVGPAHQLDDSRPAGVVELRIAHESEHASDTCQFLSGI
jgi:hypothetical protein